MGRRIALDLGCNSGRPMRRVAWSCSLAVGIDVMPHSAWARGSGLEFIVADARFLLLRSSSMGFVVAVSLLEHVPVWVSEAYCVL